MQTAASEQREFSPRGNDDLADELHRRKRVISETAAPQAARGIQPETLFRLCFTEVRRPGEGEENDLLAGYRADVVVHGHDLDAGDLLDHRFQNWTGRFNQMGPNLLQQVSPLCSRKRFDQVLDAAQMNCRADAQMNCPFGSHRVAGRAACV